MQAAEAWVLWLTSGTLVVAFIAMCFGISQWRISRRQETRETTRGVAGWQVETLSPGTFSLTNIGPDDALDVTFETWTEDEAETAHQDRLAKDEAVKVILSRREKEGPATVLLPPMTMPEVSVDPPEVAVQMKLEVQLAQWREKRQLYETVIAQREAMRRNFEAQQVSYRIIWRTENGKWDHRSGCTG